MKYLVKFEANYGDEFDVSGFDIWDTKSKFEHLAQEYFKNFKTLEICFGTNESLYFESYKELMAAFTFKEITNREAYELGHMFNFKFPGYFPEIIDILEESCEEYREALIF